MTTYRYIVEVDADTLDHAHTVMSERLNPEEDYGFEYTLGWRVAVTPKVEVLVVRDPDAGTELGVFVDGVAVSVTVERVDPGYGHTRTDWAAGTAEARVNPAYSPAFRDAVASARDDYADSQYITDEEEW